MPASGYSRLRQGWLAFAGEGAASFRANMELPNTTYKEFFCLGRLSSDIAMACDPGRCKRSLALSGIESR